MHPDLQAKFPEIRTYSARGLDDPTLQARLDITPAGFHAQVLGSKGRWYIEPLPEAGTAVYQTYFRREAIQRQAFSCGVSEWQQRAMFRELRKQSLPPTTEVGPTGATRRTFRLAVAATKEYSNRFGGTVSGAMAAIVTAINRVAGIYQSELSVSFTLVANNDQIIYTNANAGPYNGINGDASALLTANNTNLRSVIGTSNYDLGHVFTTGSGGLAQLGVVCLSTAQSGDLKAEGTTGLANPTGDTFYIDYVCHEFGHQFGANHTFNSTQGSCGGGNREPADAYEPGSGSTIMAYPGLCGSDDTQDHCDPYFHAHSFNEMTDYLGTVACGSSASTGNSPPSVSAPGPVNVPNNTPFSLTATGSDANGDPLTYCWEQFDLGPAAGITAADNGSSPLFRSFTPTSSATRSFPRTAVLVGESNNSGDRLPTYTGTGTRVMNFRVTARDGKGGVRQAATTVNFITATGPFRVTSQSTLTTYAAGSTQAVTWDVAGTTANGINTSQVNIRLSTDRGLTYPTLLASAVPNNGSATITIPSFASNTCRLKVEAVGNVFFAINSADFTITAPRLINVSTRLAAQTGENVAIGGFVVAGSGTRRLLVRGLGPTLTGFGVPGALADPTIELYSGSTLLSSNDNWRSTQQSEIQASGFAPSNDLEPAIIATLSAGSYTTILRGVNGTTGVGLVEVYDLESAASGSRLINLSTRGRVLTGDSIMIGGFVVTGSQSKRVLVRAIGPSLAAFGITGALSNPRLEVRNSSQTLLDQNDDWQSTNAAAITATGLAPTSALESALILTLPPASYTALVSGVNGATGVALVEVYELP